MSILSIRNLVKRYSHAEQGMTVFQGLSLEVECASFSP
jgi:hypothetical protein